MAIKAIKTKSAGTVVPNAGGLSRFVSEAGTEIPAEEVDSALLKVLEDDKDGVYDDVYEVVRGGGSSKSKPAAAKKPAAKRRAAKNPAAKRSASGVNADALTADKPMTTGDDPGDHKVNVVLEYLATADDDEIARVKEAESKVTKQFRPSKRVLEFSKEGSGS